MAARLAIVDAERSHELEHHLHVRDVAAGHSLVARFLQLALQIAWLPDAPGDGESFGCAVGKEQGQVEQGGKGEETAPCALQRDDGHEHHEADRGE